jgi:hypothetical protein
MYASCNRYFERKGEPVMIGRCPDSIIGADGKAIDGVEFMRVIMNGLKAGDTAILPPDVDPDSQKYKYAIELLTDDKRGDMFDQAIQSCNVEILRGMWVTDRAGTTGSVGAKAEAVVQAQTMADMLEQNQREFVDSVVMPQVVEPLVRYNFGDKAGEIRVVPGGLGENERAMLKDLLSKLVEVEAANASGDRLSLFEIMDGERICETLGIPMRSAQERSELEQAKAEDAEAAAERAAEAAKRFESNQPTPGDEQAVGDMLQKSQAKARGGASAPAAK